MSASTLHDYSRGAIPGADRAILIADALGVDVRWLVTGEGSMPGEQTAAHDGWVQLPYRGLSQGETGGTEGLGAPLREDWLRRAFGAVDSLWITEMPSDAFPEVAREGHPIICTDGERLVEGGLYLVRLEIGIVVRRLAAAPQGHVLTTGDTFAENASTPFRHGPAGPLLLGRVLGTLVKAI